MAEILSADAQGIEQGTGMIRSSLEKMVFEKNKHKNRTRCGRNHDGSFSVRR